MLSLAFLCAPSSSLSLCWVSPSYPTLDPPHLLHRRRILRLQHRVFSGLTARHPTRRRVRSRIPQCLRGPSLSFSSLTVRCPYPWPTWRWPRNREAPDRLVPPPAHPRPLDRPLCPRNQLFLAVTDRRHPTSPLTRRCRCPYASLSVSHLDAETILSSPWPHPATCWGC